MSVMKLLPSDLALTLLSCSGTSRIEGFKRGVQISWNFHGDTAQLWELYENFSEHIVSLTDKKTNKSFK